YQQKYDSIYLYYYFFQAEDDIRDRNVTGVQTCALPIYYPHWKDSKIKIQKLFRPINNPLSIITQSPSNGYVNVEEGMSYLFEIRSEERRVGKECRSGGT